MKGNQILQRDQEILEEIIRYYMERHEAISARTLSKVSRLALSPTTIRNLMEDLSSEGFLTSEGVSRGRIPTQKAFAIYLTRLDEQPRPKPSAGPEIAPMEEGEPPLLPSVVGQIGRYLAEQTQCVVTAALPAKDQYPLDWVRFSSIPGSKVLVAMQTLFGDLWSKMLVSPDPFPDDLLREVDRFINSNYRGRALETVRNDIMAGEPKELLADMPSLGAAFRMLRKAFEWEDEPNRGIWGLENLYRIPECQDPERLILIHRALSDDRFLERTKTRGRPVGDGWVSLGTETGYAGMDLCSLAGYSFGWRDWRAQLGVLGPMWMDYGKVLTMLAQAAEAIGQHLDHYAARLLSETSQS